jgi:hypothetical protein
MVEPVDRAVARQQSVNTILQQRIHMQEICWQGHTRQRGNLISLLFLAYFPYFEKIHKQVHDIALLSVCLWISHTLTSECHNHFLWNLVCISWHLTSSQRWILQIPPMSLCACMCITLSLLGNGSVKTLTRQQKQTDELLDVSFSMWSVSYQTKVGN